MSRRICSFRSGLVKSTISTASMAHICPFAATLAAPRRHHRFMSSPLLGGPPTGAWPIGCEL
jgi:hypothetical protein